MSWDIEFTINTGLLHEEIIGPHFNYTYNVSPMYYKAFEGISSEGFKRLNGMSGATASIALKHAIEIFKRDEKEFRKMNLDNKWSGYDGALYLLKQIKDYCDENPLVTVRIS